MPRDDGFGFNPRTIGRRAGEAARGAARSGGGGGGAASGFDDFVESLTPEQREALGLEDEGGGGRATVFKPGQTAEEMPFAHPLPRFGQGPPLSEHAYQGGYRPPRYYAGDEGLPANLAPHNIASLQRALVDAGLLDNPRWGFWDAASEGAYRKALGEANHENVDVQTLLTTYGEAAAMAEAEAKGPYVPSEPLVLRTTNKEDLAKLFRDSSAKLLGIGWNDAQIRELVDAYNWQEIKVEKDIYDQNVAREKQLYETGTTNIDVVKEANLPSPETFLENEAKRRDPGGFQAAQIGEQGGYADAFFEALGSRFG